MNENNLNYNEVKEKINIFFTEPSYLKEKFYNTIPQIYNVIKLLFNDIENNESSIENNEEFKKHLIYFNYFLPSLWLQEKYDNFKDFLIPYLFLINNYILNFSNKLDQSLIESVQSINNLSNLEKNFSRLIIASEILLTRYEHSINETNKPFMISKTYIQDLYNSMKEIEEKNQEAE